MASIANTAFEVSVSNITRNETQNIPGYFGSGTGSSFAGDICPAGFLCVRSELTDSEGYENLTTPIKNGNTWRMIAAATGVVEGRTGDHTGIYAFNSYETAMATQGTNAWRIGANTLGLELPAGQRGDFTELIVGEQYTWSAGNFSTAPTDLDTTFYATIANGRLVATSTAPTDGSVYLRIWREKNFTVGTRNASFVGYVCEVLRSVAA